MAQQLFRSEVMASRGASRLGGICLSQPLSLWMLAVLAVCAALAVVAYLVLGSYTRRATVTGRLVPTRGLATVLAPAAGVVSELHALEGLRVLAGEVLAVIAVPRTSIAGGSSGVEFEASVQERRAGLQSARQGQQRALSAQAAGLAAQIAAARNELEQVEAQIGTREQQLGISEATLARMRELHAGQYASLAQLQQQESATLEQAGAVQELRRQASSLKRNLLQLRQSLDELPGQRQTIEATTQRDLAALAQERLSIDAQGAVTITAPVAGIVAAQIVKRGQMVQQGQPLLTVLPGDGRLEAELLVPSRAAGFIATGDRVLLRYQAYPYQKFGHQQGRVASVSRSALGPSELGALLGNSGDGQPLYRVSVTLPAQAIATDDSSELLKPGMLLDADILGERRRLLEWLFEPLYSLRGRLGEG
jgi:membrane fusion protein